MTKKQAKTDTSGEYARFDEAVDMLLNGRYVDPAAKENFFKYVDGEIDREEARRRLT